ncbi:MAG: AAA family ATPase [Agitococcus sp.]|nr:AAA family ATPase [Agitococcus sp.]
MLKIIDIHVPANIPPMLADELSLILTGAIPSSAEQYFAALSLLYVSWKGLPYDISLGEASVHLAQIFIDTPPSDLLAKLSDVTLFREDPVISPLDGGSDTGAVLRWHAEQAALYWVAQIPEKKVVECISSLQTLLIAASEDESSFSNETAENMLDAITRYADAGNGLFEKDTGDDGLAFTSITGVTAFKSPDELVRYIQAQPSSLAPVERQLHGADESNSKGGAFVKGEGAIQCFYPEAAKSLSARLPRRPGESNERQLRLLHDMSNDTGWRMLTQVPDLAVLAPLYAQFPHFTEVIEFIECSIALASSGSNGQPLLFQPILLRGTPGTGKSFFAEEVARVLNGVFESRDLAVMTEAFVLTGIDASWKSSKPGIVFESIVSGPVANPIICLDEVDKCTARESHNSPLAALYTLLEPSSSARFKDEFIPLNLNASKVNWILTANNGDIPLPILSRLEEFDIREPTKDECQAIAVSVWQSVRNKSLPQGHSFPAELSSAVLSIMRGMSPRIMRKALTYAASRAAKMGLSDLSVPELEKAQNRYMKNNTRTIGF